MDPTAFEPHRARLFAIAYRMLGSAAHAEDVLQEAWLRWSAAREESVRSAGAWLTTVVTRLCIDERKSARARRESYVGPWLPEPVCSSRFEEPDPDSLSVAFLVLLEALSPAERAAYLLHEVFDYSHGEVADVLGREESACRQLVHRARQHVTEGRPRFSPSREQRQQLLGRFVHALSQGELGPLEELLARDATLWSDGGGKVRAAMHPIRGANAIARFFLGVLKKIPPGTDEAYTFEEVNGEPAVVRRTGGTVSAVLWVEGAASASEVTAVRLVLNPDKLGAV